MGKWEIWMTQIIPFDKKTTWFRFFKPTPCHLNSKNWTKFTALCGICQITRLKIKMTLVKFWWASQHGIIGCCSLSSLTHTHFTSFYSLNEHACQIPLKVQVTKTIQMPRFFGASVKQGPFSITTVNGSDVTFASPHQPNWEKILVCSICPVLA